MWHTHVWIIFIYLWMANGAFVSTPKNYVKHGLTWVHYFLPTPRPHWPATSSSLGPLGFHESAVKVGTPTKSPKMNFLRIHFWEHIQEAHKTDPKRLRYDHPSFACYQATASVCTALTALQTKLTPHFSPSRGPRVFSLPLPWKIRVPFHALRTDVGMAQL